MLGPCTPYVTAADVTFCDPQPGNPDAYVLLASQIMYRLTGMVFPGVCTSTVRPCRQCDCWSGWCNCGCEPDTIWLPNLIGITQIKIDGLVLDPSEYRIIDRDKVIRTNGASWPSSQSLYADPALPDTFAITFTHGSDIPEVVKRATIELAEELWNSDAAADNCKLPAGVTSVNRQGLSFSLDQQVDQVRQAGPTMESVMAAMAAYNPTNQRVPADVLGFDDGWTLHLA
jgi:hypothetical protein